MTGDAQTWPLAIGAAVVAAGTWLAAEVRTTQRDVESLTTSYATTEVRARDRDVDTARELAELRATVETLARLQVDALNEVRALRNKPPTTFSEAVDAAKGGE